MLQHVHIFKLAARPTGKVLVQHPPKKTFP